MHMRNMLLREKLARCFLGVVLAWSMCPTGLAMAAGVVPEGEGVGIEQAPGSKRNVDTDNGPVGAAGDGGSGQENPDGVEEVGDAVESASGAAMPSTGLSLTAAASGSDAVETEAPSGASAASADVGAPDEAKRFEGDLVGDDGGMSVTVSVDADAGVPEGSSLSVREITADDPRYGVYLSKLQVAVGEGMPERPMEACFFDVTIEDGQREVEPEAVVGVSMASDGISQGDGIVHFAGADEEAELLSAAVSDGAAEFETGSFSVYGIYRYKDADLVSDLDGLEVIIANENPANNYIAYVTDNLKSNGFAPLKGYRRFHRLIFPTDEATNPDGLRPTAWTFHALTEPDPSIGVTQDVFDRPENAGVLYTISTKTDEGTRYMRLANSRASLSETPVPLRIVPGSGDNEGKVMIYVPKGMPNDNIRLNLRAGRITNWFEGTNWAQINENDWYTVFVTENMEIVAENEQNMANKASVSALQDGDEVVLYHSEWDASTNSYVQLAINGYGDLVLLTDEGGTVGWYTQYAVESGRKMSSVKWRFTVGTNVDGTPSGYYWLQNTDTGAYLSPRALYDEDGVKIADVVLPGEGIEPGTPESFDYSVQLPGRAEGRFVSSVAAWSYKDGTEGLRIVESPDDVFGYDLYKGLYGDADEFNFAVAFEQTDLTEKRTIDSTSMGVQIKMYDYSGRSFMDGLLGSSAITGVNDSKTTWFVPRLVEPVLVDGMPVAVSSGEPLAGLFGDDIAMEANHLFLESVYNETGYYAYDSSKNYAYFNQDGEDAGNFTVYNELGSPRGSNSTTRSHSHFMPFSRLLETLWPEKNTMDKFAHDLPIDDPRYGDDVHQVETAPRLDGGYDYQFGMTVETTFLQTLTKFDEYGHDSILEFTGDDDLWVFIDDVLVLDLGGIHAAVSGKINFTTGDISYGVSTPKSGDGTDADVPLPPTTIRACFEQAGVFPDGTPWDDALADSHFDGNTLKSAFRGHTMKLFFLERGGNASNFDARFNLRPVRTDSVLVGKTVSGTRKQSYMNEDFMFQAFKADGTPMDEAMVATMTGRGMWEMTDEEVTFETVRIGGVTYGNVFRLSHGEGAYFPIGADEGYYVREVGIDPDRVGEVTVNGEPASGPSRTQNAGDAALEDVESDVEEASGRREVVFDNEMLSGKLRITKSLVLASGQRPDPETTFRFRVMVGADAQSLSPYSVGPYYVRTEVDGEQVYCTRVDGRIVPLSQRDDGTYYYLVDGEEVTISNKDATDPVFDYSSQTGYIDYVPAGYTVEVQGMLPGMAFSVEETGVPEGYRLASIGDGGDGTFDVLSDEGAEVLVGRMRDDADAEVAVSNRYMDGTFRLRKVSSADETEYLPGALFELYATPPANVGGETVFDRDDVLARFESDADGFLEVLSPGYYGADAGDIDLSLAEGTYYLRETKAPDGYVLDNPVSSFSIDENGDLHVNGLVDWDPVTGEMVYTSRDNLEVGEDTEVGGVVLQTGMISNVKPPDEIDMPMTGGAGDRVLPCLLGFAAVAAVLLLGTLRTGKRRVNSS